MNRRQLYARALGCALALVAVAHVSAQTPNASGEVMKLDKEQLRITLKHGEIKNLDMPPMTMVFRVKDRQLVQELAVGDRVRFAAERIDGNYTVIALSKAP
jgi:Cu(I)/Ag(I) efflux system periplasmic protein CusF